MGNKLVFLIAILTLSGLTQLGAGTWFNGPPMLQLAPDARSTACGGAGLGLSDGPGAVCWNPGALAGLQTACLSASYMRSYFDADYGYLGAVIPLMNAGALGVGFRIFNNNFNDSPGQRDSAGHLLSSRALSAADYSVSAAWGVDILPGRLSAGLGTGVVVREFVGQYRSVIPFDLGADLRNPGLKFVRNFSLAAQNILTVSLAPSGEKGWVLPLIIRAGGSLGFDLAALSGERKVELIVPVQVNLVSFSAFSVRLGAEVSFLKLSPDLDVSVRAGVRTDAGGDFLSMLSLGAGMVFAGRAFDIAYNPGNSDSGSAVQLSLSWKVE